MDPLLIGAVLWTICAILAAIVANVRGTDPMHGFILGLVAGPLGVVLVAVQEPAEPVRWEK